MNINQTHIGLQVKVSSDISERKIRNVSFTGNMEKYKNTCVTIIELDHSDNSIRCRTHDDKSYWFVPEWIETINIKQFNDELFTLDI